MILLAGTGTVIPRACLTSVRVTGSPGSYSIVQRHIHLPPVSGSAFFGERKPLTHHKIEVGQMVRDEVSVLRFLRTIGVDDNGGQPNAH